MNDEENAAYGEPDAPSRGSSPGIFLSNAIDAAVPEARESFSFSFTPPTIRDGAR